MSEQQEAFIETLMALARRDADRASTHPDDAAQRSVAMWMASEVERHATEMELPTTVARTLREQAKALRQRLRGMPGIVAA